MSVSSSIKIFCASLDHVLADRTRLCARVKRNLGHAAFTPQTFVLHPVAFLSVSLLSYGFQTLALPSSVSSSSPSSSCPTQFLIPPTGNLLYIFLIPLLSLSLPVTSLPFATYRPMSLFRRSISSCVGPSSSPSSPSPPNSSSSKTR